MSLKCCACSIVKSLDKFSKTQKSKKDTPRCKSCIQSEKPVITSLDIPGENPGSHRRCSNCNMRKSIEEYSEDHSNNNNNNNINNNDCKDCQRQKRRDEEERTNRKARTPSTGACQVKDVKKRYGHLCEIPLAAYREAGVASHRNDYVTKRDVEAASDAWDARSIAHDIDTQWGSMPWGGAYSDSNHYYGPGEYDYY